MKINLLKIPVYYINLDKDAEKRERLESLLYDIGFKNVNRFAGEEIATPKLGCATSHNKLLRHISKVKGPVLVLEDDVDINKVYEELTIPEKSDAVYLGISKFGLYNGYGHKRIVAEKHDDTFFRLYNMLSAHAILYLNKEYRNFLIQTSDFLISIADNQDKGRAETMKYFNVYGLSEPMFYQSGKHEKVTKFNINDIPTFKKGRYFI